MKNNPKLTLYFDPNPAVMDTTPFIGSNAEEFCDQYRGANKELPTDVPKSIRISVGVTVFVGAYYAYDKKTRRHHTGYTIFVNCAPIIWYRKRQATV